MVKGQDAHSTESRAVTLLNDAAGAFSGQDTAGIEQVPRVPGLSASLRHLNAGLTFSGVNAANSGWYTVITPAVSYSLDSHFSADLSFSAYLDRSVETETTMQVSTVPGGNNTPNSVTIMGTRSHNDPGDLMLGMHASFGAEPWRNLFTTSLTFPTGSMEDGLSTGTVTFDFSNRLERTLGAATLMVGVGVGNSAGLVNSLVTRQYDTLGPLSHYQTGVSVWMPRSVYLQMEAYEQLPFGRQTLYVPIRKESQSGTKTTTTATSFGADDFGLTTFVSVPLQSHILLSGYFSRSLRENYNTYSIGTTFMLHPILRHKLLRMIDKALMEAEGRH